MQRLAMALLTVRDLSVAAGGSPLLQGLSLELRPGHMTALVGPSGSGKTSLLRALAGLDDPAEGEVRLLGRLPAEWGWPVWRRRVCWVSQRPVLLDGTVRMNLARPFEYATTEGPFPEEQALTYLDRLGLERTRVEQNALTLSEGQRQRVALARALLVGPPVMLLDEPTSALDPAALEATESLVRQTVDGAGAGALVVTHDRAQAERWCDDILDLADWGPRG